MPPKTLSDFLLDGLSPGGNGPSDLVLSGLTPSIASLLVVQTDGLPLADDANAYIATAYLKAYAGLRLWSLTPYSESELERAVAIATQYVDLRFEYVGWRMQNGQTTEWPRNGAFDNRSDRVVGVPKLVKDACCEYAWRVLSQGTELLPDPAQDDSGLTVTHRSEKVGPIEEDVSFDRYTSGSLPPYPMADRLLQLRGYTSGGKTSGFSVGRLGRA